jgi:outer membrane lipoprotein-sorting protein
LTLDIDRRLYLPVHVRFEEASGAVTEYWFSDLESNADIPSELFTLQLPPEVEVREVVVGAAGESR